jgi:hypothetical protein
MAKGHGLGDCVPEVKEICWICADRDVTCGGPSCWDFVDGNNPFPGWLCNGCPPLAWQIKVDDCNSKREIRFVDVKVHFKTDVGGRWKPLYKDGSQRERKYPYTSFGDVDGDVPGSDFPGRDVNGLDLKTGYYRISAEINGVDASRKTMELMFWEEKPDLRDLQDGCDEADGCYGPQAIE